MQIENIFIVHWKKLLERRKYLQRELPEDIIWMDMYDRNAISDETISSVFTYDDEELWYNRLDGLYKDVPIFRNLKLSEICNSLSHIDILDHIIENNINMSLILEDDVILCNNFMVNVDENLKNTPSDFDIIFLGSSYSITILDSVGCDNKESAKMVRNNIYEKIRNPKTRTVDSYIVKYDTAKKLRNIIDRISLPYDFDLAYFIKELELKTYWWDPGLVTQGSMTGRYSSSIR
jgi:GR25 family glycosyltransferase involved in LPS biosynthesis